MCNVASSRQSPKSRRTVRWLRRPAPCADAASYGEFQVNAGGIPTLCEARLFDDDAGSELWEIRLIDSHGDGDRFQVVIPCGGDCNAQPFVCWPESAKGSDWRLTLALALHAALKACEQERLAAGVAA